MSLELAMNRLNRQIGKIHREEMQCPLDIDALQTLLHEKFPQEATLVLWQMQGIQWARCSGGKLFFPDEKPCDTDSISYLQEIRAFDKSGELHLKKIGDVLWGRWISDFGEETATYIDSLSPFWGEAEGRTDNCSPYAVLIDESRKFRMELPVESYSRRYGLVTRNYISRNDRNGQAGYTDYRFVRIEGIGGEAHV